MGVAAGAGSTEDPRAARPHRGSSTTTTATTRQQRPYAAYGPPQPPPLPPPQRPSMPHQSTSYGWTYGPIPPHHLAHSTTAAASPHDMAAAQSAYMTFSPPYALSPFDGPPPATGSAAATFVHEPYYSQGLPPPSQAPQQQQQSMQGSKALDALEVASTSSASSAGSPYMPSNGGMFPPPSSAPPWHALRPAYVSQPSLQQPYRGPSNGNNQPPPFMRAASQGQAHQQGEQYYHQHQRPAPGAQPQKPAGEQYYYQRPSGYPPYYGQHAGYASPPSDMYASYTGALSYYAASSPPRQSQQWLQQQQQQQQPQSRPASAANHRQREGAYTPAYVQSPPYPAPPASSSSQQDAYSPPSTSQGRRRSPAALPEPYAPPRNEQIARGARAHVALRDALFDVRGDRGSGRGRAPKRLSSAPSSRGSQPTSSGSSSAVQHTHGGTPRAGRSPTRSSRMPRPPEHSPWALWVGNVPSDATYEELSSFFVTRSPPARSRSHARMILREQLAPEADGDEAIIEDAQDDEDALLGLMSVGVESVHLIRRSNCAFVNYASQLHMEHAIKEANGKSLRPRDPRCKELVCRVRRRDDDTRSGVGAQRIGGMHRAYVAAKEREQQIRDEYDVSSTRAESNVRTEGGDDEGDDSGAPKRPGPTTQQERLSHSTSSTSSGFLSKHFSKRYFVLKSLNEDDLWLSAQRGMWATQQHNEPVLDQAFRTAREGVILFFGANKTGEWFGYARMTSAIRRGPQARSTGSSVSTRTAGSTVMSFSIPEESPMLEGSAISSESSPSVVTSPGHVVERSPAPLTPASSANTAASTPASSHSLSLHPSAALDARSAALEARNEAAAQDIAQNLHLPEDRVRGGETPVERTLDARMSREFVNGLRLNASDPVKLSAAGASPGAPAPSALDEHGVRRRDMIAQTPTQIITDHMSPGSSTSGPTSAPAATSQAPLPLPAAVSSMPSQAQPVSAASPPAPLVGEQWQPNAPQQQSSGGSSTASWGNPFGLEWVKIRRLPFHKTRHIRNAFNNGKEIKISRDGTEVEPAAGEQLIEAFWADAESDAEQARPPFDVSQLPVSAQQALSPP